MNSTFAYKYFFTLAARKTTLPTPTHLLPHYLLQQPLVSRYQHPKHPRQISFQFHPLHTITIAQSSIDHSFSHGILCHRSCLAQSNMPSSSQCDTYQENQLMQDCKRVMMRFAFHNMHAESNHVRAVYSDILELPLKALTKHITKDIDDWKKWVSDLLEKR